MIRIQEHYSSINSDVFFIKKVIDHWDYLNPTDKKFKYKSNALISKCEKYNIIPTKQYVETYANNSPIAAKRHRNFFKFLINKNYSQLKRIIMAEPTQFESIISDVLNLIYKDDLFYGDGTTTQTKFGKLLSTSIFNYKKFRSSNYQKDLYTELGFKKATCPYCNYHPINIVSGRDISKSASNEIGYFDLDHFLPKNRYPFLALSFYNLIPCCHICNAILKRDRDVSLSSLIHPYFESFDESYLFKIPISALIGDQVTEVNFESKNVKSQDQTISIFNLQSLYSNHLDEINDLIKSYRNLRSRHSNDEQSFADFFFETRSVPRTKFEILKKPFGKLYRDILLQLDESNMLN